MPGRRSRKPVGVLLSFHSVVAAMLAGQAAGRNIYDPAISAIVPRIGSFGGGTR